MSHELTLQEIDQFRSDFDNSRNQVVSRAAMRSGVLDASFNLYAMILVKNIRLKTSPYLKHTTSSGIRLNVLIFSMMQLLILQISP